ncbi:MAG: response regulator transcription factor [Candidatus Doudnabacteria bacterium]|nr:response regulator transcription factor [Candidatus Doudnabacteria bacterium]
MKVLIIEDEKEIASFTKKGLEAERFTVDTAPDGEKGLYLAKINDYDCVVMDIMMPKKTGLQVCEELRKEKHKVPILILSVKSEIQDKVTALNLGADDYLIKPFAIEELVARIRSLIRRKATIQSNVLKLNGLTLDTITNKVWRNDKPISLRRKEFMLLEYMMRNPGVTLTRSMILEHVWDMNADPFTNTVDVHVRYLRNKIDMDFYPKLIHTIHGVGYKLMDEDE